MSETDNVIPFRPRPRSRDEELADVLTDVRNSGDHARRLLGELRARSTDRAEKKPTPIAELRKTLQGVLDSLAALERDLEARSQRAAIQHALPQMVAAIGAIVSGMRYAAPIE